MRRGALRYACKYVQYVSFSADTLKPVLELRSSSLMRSSTYGATCASVQKEWIHIATDGDGGWLSVYLYRYEKLVPRLWSTVESSSSRIGDLREKCRKDRALEIWATSWGPILSPTNYKRALRCQVRDGPSFLRHSLQGPPPAGYLAP